MKIENIIEDIIRDITEIKDKLEVQIRKEYPHLNFTVTLPGIERLSPIKLIELSVTEEARNYTSRAEIHTHNGNRVFEDSSYLTTGNHPFHKYFIDLLREIIKKRKLHHKPGNKL